MPYAWCVIEEVEFENWGIGGNQVTAEMLQAVIAGKA
jgi:phenylpyruvate tautomerase PptA (4-oxalocrotonate tautomerase family)